MRVALHLPFVLQRNTGITRYIFGLLGALAAADTDIRFCCFVPPQAELPPLPPRFERIALPAGGGGAGNPLGRILREGATLTRAYRKETWDVLHAPHSYLPLNAPGATVVTLADLRVLRYPRTFSRLRGQFLRWAIPRSLRRADRVLAMSHATRDECLALVPGVLPSHIEVAYPGVDDFWFASPGEGSLEAARTRLGLMSEYLLTVGTWEPHKNLPRVLEAFARIRADAHPHLHLALVGATFATGTSDDLRGVVAEHRGIAPFIHSPGVVSDSDLRAIYAGARALIFPSLYEGFGYPPLEAMAVGTPVVTSNLSCLPEIVGDAAELVNPLEADDIERGLRQVLESANRRDELRARGEKQVRRYRWAAHGAAVLTAYCTAANQSPQI